MPGRYLRNKKIRNTTISIILGLTVLSVLFRIGATQTLKILKTKITTSIEKNSDIAEFRISGIKLNIFSSIILEDINMQDKKGNSFSTHAIKIRYSLLDMILKKIDLLGSIRSITITKLDLHLIEPSFTNSITLTKDLTRIKTQIYNSRIQIEIHHKNILLDNINGSLKLIQTNLLSGKFSGDAQTKLNKTQISLSGHILFTFNLKTGYLNLYNNLHDIAVNKIHYNSLSSHIQMNTNIITIKNLNIDNHFFGNLSAHLKQKSLKFQGQFRNFPLPPYLANYSANGSIAVYLQKNLSLSSYLSLSVPDKSDKWFIRIRNNKIIKIIRTQNNKETINIAYHKQQKKLTGLIHNFTINNIKLNSHFSILYQKKSAVLFLNDLLCRNQTCFKNYKIYFYNNHSKTYVKSQDARLYGVINKKNWNRSFLKINLNSLSFPLKTHGKTKKIVLNGYINLNPSSLLLKKASVKINNNLLLDFLSLNYSISSSSLAFYAAKNQLSYSGNLILHGSKIILNSSFFYHNKQKKIKTFIRKEKNKWLFSIQLDGKNISSGWYNNQGNFKQKIVLRQQKPYTRFNGVLYGNIHTPDRIKGYGNGIVKKIKNNFLLVPKINFSFLLREHKNLLFKFIITDQYNKKMQGNGRLLFKNHLQLQADFIHSISLQWDYENKNQKLIFDINNFNLQNLNGLLRPSYTLAGVCYSKFTKKYDSPHWNIKGKINRFAVNNFSVKSLLWNAVYQKNKITIKNISLIMPEGKIAIEKGLVSFSPQKLLFSSLINYDIQKQNNHYSGMMQITGDNNSQFTRIRSDFLNTRMNDLFIEQYSQFFSYNKKIKTIKLFTDKNGLTGTLQFTPQKNIKNIDLVFKTKKSDLFFIQGNILSKQNIRLNISHINADLSYIKYFSPFIKYAAGSITGNLRIRGNSQNPKIFGSLKINNKKLKLTEGIREIRNLQGNMLFNGDTSEIDFKSDINKVPVNLIGSVSYQNLSVSDYNINLSMPTNNFIYIKSFNDIQGYANINLNISKNDEGLPAYSGMVYIKKMDFTFPFVGTFVPKGKPEPVYLDIKIYALKNVHYFQADSSIDIDLKPGSFLILSGVFPEPVKDHQLTGNIVMEKGSIEYLGTPFNIIKGHLVFSDEYDPDLPYLTLSAETKIQQDQEKYILHLEAEGLLDKDLKPNIYAVPSLTKREILRLLGYGRLYSSIALKINNQTNEINVETSKEQEIDKLFVAGFLTYFDQAYKKILIKPVERRIKKIFNLDKVEIKSDLSKNIIEKGLVLKENKAQTIPIYSVYDALNNSQIILGKYLTDFLFIEYMFSLRKEDYLGNPNIIPQHQLGLELDLKDLTFEWRYEPSFLYNFKNPNANNEIELKWEKQF